MDKILNLVVMHGFTCVPLSGTSFKVLNAATLSVGSVFLDEILEVGEGGEIKAQSVTKAGENFGSPSNFSNVGLYLGY